MNYCIIPTADLDNINFTEIIESINTLRYNLEGSEFIVKFKGSTPLDLQQYQIYTHLQIRTLITNPSNGWQKE
tara:strand:- start:749 stop:967 length:219 start_codon:yes stop_codon:yes gene_type:complete